jgi:hypothetical protein
MRAFRKLGGNVGGTARAVKSGVLYPASPAIGRDFAPQKAIFSKDCRRFVTHPPGHDRAQPTRVFEGPAGSA